MLHIVSQSPFQSSALADALNIAQSGDAVILIDDGSYGIQSPLLANTSANILVLDDALKARGIRLNNASKASSITMAQWVELTFEHSQSLSWY